MIENPIRSFSQIQNVFFCYGQFSHLVVVNTENRLVVWNLLSLKIQVSAAITVDRIAFDPITNLIASFTKDKELYVFLPNIPMPLYHRSNMPQVFGAVWVPRRYPSSQSFNVDWQATSQLFFLNEKQELLHLVSDNDEDMLAPVDSDDEEILVADEGGNQSKTPFAAMLAKQVVGSNVQRISEVRSGNNIGVAGKSAVRDIVGSSSHTMAPVNLLCRDFLRSLLITEENRAKEGNSQDQQGETGNNSLNSTNDPAVDFRNEEELSSNDNMIQLREKINTRKATAAAVSQMKQNHVSTTANVLSTKLKKLPDELIEIVF